MDGYTLYVHQLNLQFESVPPMDFSFLCLIHLTYLESMNGTKVRFQGAQPNLLLHLEMVPNRGSTSKVLFIRCTAPLMWYQFLYIAFICFAFFPHERSIIQGIFSAIRSFIQCSGSLSYLYSQKLFLGALSVKINPGLRFYERKIIFRT